jgi:hypothetical protein
VRAPTLLVVGGRDEPVIALNEEARDRMRCEVRIDAIPGATHLFEEPGALEEVARRATAWFVEHLDPPEAVDARAPSDVVRKAPAWPARPDA